MADADLGDASMSCDSANDGFAAQILLPGSFPGVAYGGFFFSDREKRPIKQDWNDVAEIPVGEKWYKEVGPGSYIFARRYDVYAD